MEGKNDFIKSDFGINTEKVFLYGYICSMLYYCCVRSVSLCSHTIMLTGNEANYSPLCAILPSWGVTVAFWVGGKASDGSFSASFIAKRATSHVLKKIFKKKVKVTPFKFVGIFIFVKHLLNYCVKKFCYGSTEFSKF